MLHDTSRAFGAEHAFIDWMVFIALDVADAAIFKMDPYTAPARAHIAGGCLHLFRDDR